MGIFSRLGDIINANLNAVLERAEDPEKIIKLMIQEMEDTLVEVRSTAARAIAEKKERQRAITFLEQEAIDWEQKAELAVRKDREDLARAALTEKKRVEAQTDRIKQELGSIDEQLAKFTDDISKLQSKLDDARKRQAALVRRQQTAQSQLKMRGHIHNERIDDIMHRFESAERKIDQVESEAEVLDMGRTGLAGQIDALEDEDRINEELQALRERMKKASKNKA
ncbi:MAG: phage shock protein PspA [Lysobacteraceae bacterium]|nr:MAG: phage shock protein PspA [Xanthomonadaceae bacterium]